MVHNELLEKRKSGLKEALNAGALEVVFEIKMVVDTLEKLLR